MSYLYTYILAPDVDNNGAILHQFAALFPDLVSEERIKTVSKKSPNDIFREDGSVLVQAGAKYFLAKVTTAEFDPSMIEGVTDAELYNRDNLPFNDYWL